MATCTPWAAFECDEARATTWDHVIPVSKGGETAPDNILPACNECNSSKKNSNLWEWLDRYGLKEPEFAIFAASSRGEWCCSEWLFAQLGGHGVMEVPALFRGSYDRAKIAEIAERDTSINSAPKGHMMEGVVIVAEPPKRDPNIGRVALKLISNRYWES